MKVLVVGGAGYIGSHVVKQLKKENYDVIVFDNLENGHKEVCETLGAPLIVGDLRDVKSLSQLDSHKFDACFNFAAYTAVGESVEDPYLYFENNYVGNLNLLNYLKNRNCNKFIFSSTSEVYGEAKYLPIDENHVVNPLNPYGISKRMVEQTLDWFGNAYGMKYVVFRYFNAAGCSHDGEIGELHDPELHLIPSAVLGAMGKKEFKLTCNKVDTKDGTPIRDYVHVEDLATAHILGLKYLEKDNKSDYFNIGTGKGYSVLEVVEAVEKVTGVDIDKNYGEVRVGEAAEKHASYDKAEKVLGWKPKYGLDDMVKTTYDFFGKI